MQVGCLLNHKASRNGRIRTCVFGLLALPEDLPRLRCTAQTDLRSEMLRSLPDVTDSCRLLVISVITHCVVPAWRGFSRTHRIPPVSRAYSGCAVDQIGAAGFEPAT